MFFGKPYILFILGGAAILLMWNLRLEWKLRKLSAGKSGASLEEVISSLGTRQKRLEEFKQELETYLKSVEARLRRAVQGIGTVRFNPFQGDGSGSNQSFATAFLDEEGNGVVFSSLYARGQMSIFAKPIENHVSGYRLTEEENAALSGAKEKCTGI